MMIYRGKSPEEAYFPFSKLYPPLPPFRDASSGLSTMSMTILECLSGLEKARSCKFFDIETFDQRLFDLL